MRYLALLSLIALAACDRPLFEPLPKAAAPTCSKSSQVIHGDSTLRVDSQRVSITVCVHQ